LQSSDHLTSGLGLIGRLIRAKLLMSQHRNWCFTINNPTTDQLFKSQTQIKLCTASLEVGESGTVHYQGYLELKTSRSLNQTKALFTDEWVHLEQRRGSKNQAMEYSLKTYTTVLKESDSLCNNWNDTTFNIPTIDLPSTPTHVITIGLDGSYKELMSTLQEKKTKKQRLTILKDKILNGSDELDIANEDFELWVKYNKAFSHYRLLCSTPRKQKTKVFVVQGPTGVGKSYWARQQDANAYWKPRNNWWDGYTNQNTVIIDEFYGWLPYDLLLRLGDEYPLQVECKGGSINFNSKKLIITTNNLPHTWYSNVYFQAFIRRVDLWVVIPERGIINTFNDHNNVIWHSLN